MSADIRAHHCGSRLPSTDLAGSSSLTDELRIDAGVNNAFNFPAAYDPLGQSFFLDVIFKTD